jgi:hypothetical protein
MKINAGSIGARLAPLALVAIIACEDRNAGPVGLRAAGPHDPSADSASAMLGSVLSGRFVLSIREPSAGLGPGRIVAADTGDYETPFAGSAVPGGANGTLILRGEAMPLRMFVAAGTVNRQGRWEHQVAAARDGHARVIRFSAAAGAPPSEVEFVRGGQVFLRIATAWTRTAGGWRMLDRVITVFSNGRATRTIEWAFGEPEVASGPRLRSSPVFSLVPTAAPDAVSFDVSGGGCESQAGAVFDAAEQYESSVSLATIACFAGPWSCIGALAAVYAADRNLSGAQGAFQRCLAAM